MSVDDTDVRDDEHVEDHLDHELSHAPQEHKEPTDGQYILIAVALIVLTALEVAASYVDVGPLLVPLLMVMMAIKFLVVVFFFMHLRFDNSLFRNLFFTGLILAIVVYVVAMMTFHFFLN
jgi:cytochrome c oxidase subunit 4